MSKSKFNCSNLKYELKPSNNILNAANCQPVSAVRTACITVRYRGFERRDLLLYVVDCQFPTLFGRQCSVVTN